MHDISRRGRFNDTSFVLMEKIIVVCVCVCVCVRARARVDCSHYLRMESSELLFSGPPSKRYSTVRLQKSYESATKKVDRRVSLLAGTANVNAAWTRLVLQRLLANLHLQHAIREVRRHRRLVSRLRQLH